jgi:hypothetical protein
MALHRSVPRLGRRGAWRGRALLLSAYMGISMAWPDGGRRRTPTPLPTLFSFFPDYAIAVMAAIHGGEKGGGERW